MATFLLTFIYQQWQSEVLHNTNMVFPATNEIDMLPENYRNSNQIS